MPPGRWHDASKIPTGRPTSPSAGAAISPAPHGPALPARNLNPAGAGVHFRRNPRIAPFGGNQRPVRATLVLSGSEFIQTFSAVLRAVVRSPVNFLVLQSLVQPPQQPQLLRRALLYPHVRKTVLHGVNEPPSNERTAVVGHRERILLQQTVVFHHPLPLTVGDGDSVSTTHHGDPLVAVLRVVRRHHNHRLDSLVGNRLRLPIPARRATPASRSTCVCRRRRRPVPLRSSARIICRLWSFSGRRPNAFFSNPIGDRVLADYLVATLDLSLQLLDPLGLGIALAVLC